MTIWTMGINQSTHGSDGVVAINNLSLITGNIGKPGGTNLSITGQCNAMGTREWSSCSGLPGYRALEKPAGPRTLRVSGVSTQSSFPKRRGLFATDILPAIETGQIKGLWLIATNPMTSMPNTPRICKTLEARVPCRAGCLPRRRDQRICARLPARCAVGREGRLHDQYRATREPYPQCLATTRREAKADLWIFNRLAKRFAQAEGMEFPEQAEQVFDEIRELSRGRMLDYSGMSYAKIEAYRGMQWRALIHPTGGPATIRALVPSDFTSMDALLSRRGAKADPVAFRRQQRASGCRYPFWFNSGRVVEHFHAHAHQQVGNQNKFSPTHTWK